MYGWAEAIEALLEDESVVRAGDGHQQPLREAMMADSQGHHRCGALSTLAPLCRHSPRRQHVRGLDAPHASA